MKGNNSGKVLGVASHVIQSYLPFTTSLILIYKKKIIAFYWAPSIIVV